MQSILVLCVDKDNDLGKKGKVKAPLYGRKEVLNGAETLLLKDPEETDGNSMFAALKKYDELKGLGKKVEIAVVTGKGKIGFGSDEELLRQVDIVLKKSGAKDIVFVSDGAEDSSIIPLLQGRAKIISKVNVIIKQAERVESTVYTLKEILKDKDVAKVVFGLPGFAFLSLAVFGDLGFKVLGFLLGIYLLAVGFDINKYFKDYIKIVLRSLYEQRVSFLFYFASVFSLIFGAANTYVVYTGMEIIDINNGLIVLSSSYAFLFLFGLSFLIGKIIDAFHFKKAYTFRKYLLLIMSLFVLWLVLVSGTNVLLAEVDVDFFILNLVGGLIAFLVTYKITEPFEFTNKVSKLLMNVRVFDSSENYLGRVSGIDKRKQQIIVSVGEKDFVYGEGQFLLKDGKLVVR